MHRSTQALKALHLSTYDTGGGAARSAYRLHMGLRRLGHDSLMFVAQKRSNDPTVRAFTPTRDLLSRLRRRLRQEQIERSFARYRTTRPSGYEPFSSDRSEYGATLLDQLPPCDVISLHWIAGFVDYRTFFTTLSQHTPIVWRLSDLNAFTGGCHYDHGCGKYTTRCGACPQLGSHDDRDLSFQVWQRKRAIFGRIEPERLHIVAQSRWMANEVKNSVLLGNFPVAIIPNGLDVNIFSPRNHRVARDALEIPQDANVVLFAAQSVSNRRKGFALLAQALIGLSDLPNLFLVGLGSDRLPIKAQIPHLYLGHLDNDRLLSLVYSAADLFVIPSLEDNLPNTVLESLACGTPVVGFAVGGIPDMVRPGVTGLLAPPQDVSGLRAVITELLQDQATRAEMSASCRHIAVEEYALEVQARRYIELYESILYKNERRAVSH